VFCPWLALQTAQTPLSKKATTQPPPKSIYFDHEIMDIGLICSNLGEKDTAPAILGITLVHAHTI
jgi:hypothetical protein